MSEGLKLKFHTAPPLSFTPPPGTQTSDSQAQLIVPLLPKLIERNYIREIKTPQKLYFSRVFTRPKKNGSLRPIIDLSKLNKLLVIPRFHMETVANISNSLVAMLWGCTPMHGGHQGCLPKCSPKLALPQVLRLQNRKQNLCVAVPSIRTLHSTLDLHQGNETHQVCFTQTTSASSLLLGRLHAAHVGDAPA